MKIELALSSRRRSPTKSTPVWLHEPEPLPKQPEQPDLLSKMLPPATDESRAAAETTNESDESRTTAAATTSKPGVFAVFSSVVSEGRSIGDDLSRLKTETESVIKRTAKVISTEFEEWRLKRAASAEWSVSSEQNKVKGHSQWAKEIKKLAKSERKKEKTENQITKFDEQITNYEDSISTLEEEQVETRKAIKALYQKAMLSGGSNQDEENGLMSDWATEVKRLGQLERKKKKAEKQLAKADKQMTKYEKCLSKTEQKHQETVKNIKFLSYYHCDDDSVASW